MANDDFWSAFVLVLILDPFGNLPFFIASDVVLKPALVRFYETRSAIKTDTASTHDSQRPSCRAHEVD